MKNKVWKMLIILLLIMFVTPVCTFADPPAEVKKENELLHYDKDDIKEHFSSGAGREIAAQMTNNVLSNWVNKLKSVKDDKNYRTVYYYIYGELNGRRLTYGSGSLEDFKNISFWDIFYIGNSKIISNNKDKIPTEILAAWTETIWIQYKAGATGYYDVSNLIGQLAKRIENGAIEEETLKSFSDKTVAGIMEQFKKLEGTEVKVDTKKRYDFVKKLSDSVIYAWMTSGIYDIYIEGHAAILGEYCRRQVLNNSVSDEELKSWSAYSIASMAYGIDKTDSGSSNRTERYNEWVKMYRLIKKDVLEIWQTKLESNQTTEEEITKKIIENYDPTYPIRALLANNLDHKNISGEIEREQENLNIDYLKRIYLANYPLDAIEKEVLEAWIKTMDNEWNNQNFTSKREMIVYQATQRYIEHELDYNKNFSGWVPTIGKLDNNKLTQMTGNILGVLQTIGSIVSIIALIIIGMKYMIGSVEEKAKYKETLIPYIIGCALVFGISNIVAIIYKIAVNL